MSDSPYAPPRAAVADRDADAPLPPRPPAMRFVAPCVWGDYALAVVSLVLQLGTAANIPGLPLMIGFYVVLFALVAWVYSALLKGRNWGRIAYCVLFGLSALGTVMELVGYFRPGSQTSILELFLSALSLLIELYVIHVIFTAPARAWFRAIREAA